MVDDDETSIFSAADGVVLLCLSAETALKLRLLQSLFGVAAVVGVALLPPPPLGLLGVGNLPEEDDDVEVTVEVPEDDVVTVDVEELEEVERDDK